MKSRTPTKVQISQKDSTVQASTLPFADFKTSLGVSANNYTDEQIEEIWIIFDRIADLAFDAWLSDKNEHNKVTEKTQKNNDESTENREELRSPMSSKLYQADRG